MRPLAVDLFCGLGGWTEGLLAEGYDLARDGYSVRACAVDRAGVSPGASSYHQGVRTGSYDVVDLELEAASLARRRLPTKTIWTPNPGMQARALHCIETQNVDQIWLMGEAGGGKTAFGHFLGLTHFTNSIFFRKEFSDLGGAEGPIETGRRWFSPYKVGRGFNENTHMWRLDCLGKRRFFEYSGCRSMVEAQSHQGKARELFVFDEITQLLPGIPAYITGWRRTDKVGQRTLELYMGNAPLNAEGTWVLDRILPWVCNNDHPYPRPAIEGEIRYFIGLRDGTEREVPGPERVLIDGEPRLPLSRTFFFCRLKENPAYAETGYADRLDRMAEPERSILLKGDFWAGTAEDAWQVIPSDWIRLAQERRRLENAAGFNPRAAGEEADTWGWDIAHGGADCTTAVGRWGRWLSEPEVWSGTATPDGLTASGLIKARLSQYGGVASIDANGCGASAYDFAREDMGERVRGILVQRGTTLRDRARVQRFRTIRDFMWWNARELLDPTHPECVSCPLDPLLAPELRCARWEPTSSGVKISPKEDMKLLLGGRSPDRAEAFLLSLLPQNLDLMPGAGFIEYIESNISRGYLDSGRPEA